MSDLTIEHPIPKLAIQAGAGLIAFTILCAIAGRYADIGTSHVPPSPVVETRPLRFFDASNGSVLVKDAETGSMVEVIPSGQGGFVRGTMRGLARDRRMRHVDDKPPFILARRADGRLLISDPTNGREIELNGFGATNLEAFARMMDRGRDTR